ncbi:MAG: DNA-binding transcriptional LysR family regulator [Flavobacteriales bacterium]|jgi:DNA-binding transcriptional LysR family regulator
MKKTHSAIGTVRQLEILLSVYKHQNISKAAAALHLTQPSVSMQLAKLANTIGLPLYYIVGKQLRFTEAGEVIVRNAQEILKRYEYLNLEIAQLKGLKAGSLNLSVVTTAKYFIPHLIGDFSRSHPGINIQFKVGNRQNIIARTERDDDDFYVFSHPPQNPDLELIDFLPNRLHAIVPETHELADHNNISLKAFSNEPFLMREEGSGTRLAIENFCKKNGLTITERMTIESNEAIKHAVMSGLGVSILSEHTLTYGGLAGLKILKVKGLPILTQWYLVRRKSRPSSPAAEIFLAYAKAQGEALFQDQLI